QSNYLMNQCTRACNETSTNSTRHSQMRHSLERVRATIDCCQSVFVAIWWHTENSAANGDSRDSETIRIQCEEVAAEASRPDTRAVKCVACICNGSLAWH